jgi:hypothetical protein
MSALYGIQMRMPVTGARSFQAFDCTLPAIHATAPAGSWSHDLTNRKPGPPRLTSVSAT